MTELEILKWILGTLLGSLGIIIILCVGVGRVLANLKNHNKRLDTHSGELVALSAAIIQAQKGVVEVKGIAARIEQKIDNFIAVREVGVNEK